MFFMCFRLPLFFSSGVYCAHPGGRIPVVDDDIRICQGKDIKSRGRKKHPWRMPTMQEASLRFRFQQEVG
jgi:hypothetical protein